MTVQQFELAQELMGKIKETKKNLQNWEYASYLTNTIRVMYTNGPGDITPNPVTFDGFRQANILAYQTELAELERQFKAIGNDNPEVEIPRTLPTDDPINDLPF